MPPESPSLPEFVSWPEFPFEGEFRVRPLDGVAEEPPREGDDPEKCPSCGAPDDQYLWVSDRWRVKASANPTGLPAVVVLESRSHLDLGDLPNLLAAELGVMTVRLERAIRSLPGVERVHVNRWGDGLAHLHLWFFARPTGQLQLRGSFLTLWKDILPPISEDERRDNLGLIAAWLADFGGRAVVDPPRFKWQPLEALSKESGAEDEPAAEGAMHEAAREDDAPGDAGHDDATPEDDASQGKLP